jgi:hypothetical protein
MQSDTEKKLAYFRGLLIESFIKENQTGFDYATNNLRKILDEEYNLPPKQSVE